MSCNRGIYPVERSALDAFAEGRARAVSSRAFGRADGMLSAECNGGIQPAGWRKSDGTPVVSDAGGIVVVDPRALHSNAVKPNVVIEQIASEHQDHPVSSEVVFEPRESHLEVHFTAPTFIRPGQASFRYRLEGLDDDWAEAGTNRFARYSIVPPGITPSA
jgi:hypothetical protein